MQLTAAKRPNIVKILSIALIVTVMAVFLFNPVKYRLSVLSGLLVFGSVILPAALPFFFFSKLLLELGVADTLSRLLAPVTRKLYRCSGESAYIFIMSVLSGYPVGAKLISEMHSQNILSDADAKRAVTFCSTSGPLFIIGSVGAGIFGSVKFGVVLLLGHILAALINGLIYRPLNYGGSAPNTAVDNASTAANIPTAAKKSFDRILSDTIYTTLIQVIIIGGYVTLFYMVADILQDLKLTLPVNFLAKIILTPFNGQDYASAFVSGLLESTKGMLALFTVSPKPSIITAALCAFIAGWGGMSVHLQNISFLLPAKVNAGFYFLSKTTQAILSVLLTLGLWKVFY